jgi:hypothetical protein
MTNKEEVFNVIQKHPEGLDDDDISTMTGIEPRQQIQQLCTQLASARRIRRESIDKAGKRRKIHNFPVSLQDPQRPSAGVQSDSDNWKRRLSALVALTGRSETDLLEESLHLLAKKILENETEKTQNQP